jgi:hypothetical protein
MEDNPYSVLVNNIREDIKSRTPVSYRHGRVITSNPLTVEVAGTVQESSELLKNSLLTSFTANDWLLLLPIENEQRYIIVCKVVDA